MKTLLTALLLTLPLAATAQTSSALTPRVLFETTAGNFTIEVDAVRAPLTAENFLRYVRDGFYDGLIVHRVVPNFVVQGGGYDASLVERPTRASIPNESGNGLSNLRGTVGMARSDTPHSASSQFYVNLKDNPGLNPLPSRWGYTVFGRVAEGLDVIEAISHIPTGSRGPFGAELPLQTVTFRRASVVGEAARPATAPSPAEPAAAPGDEPEAAPGDEPAAEPAPGGSTEASGSVPTESPQSSEPGTGADASP